MKQNFDINKVIERYKLSEEDVAEALFPNIRYKAAALARIKKGEAEIDTTQLIALSDLCGVNVQDLFHVDGIKGGYDSELKCLVFNTGEYTARLNYNGAYLSIYKGAEMIKQIVPSKDQTIEEFLNLITTTIKNYENGTN